MRSSLTYPGMSDITIKKAMIAAADITYLVADSTEIGKNALASLGALSFIDYVITDDEIDPKNLELFRENEVGVIITPALMSA